MKILKLRLQGKSAFFKKPDVNSYFYFSYGHIHKVALLGIFGAILGYKGYNQMKKEDSFPEFYEKLKDLKLAIVPINGNGVINKKINIFNNSVGYASKEQGGNLIVKEQWLENPIWDVYVLIDSEEALNLLEKIIKREFIYIPYLGKNDHMAEINLVEVLEGIKVVEFNSIDSFFRKNDYSLSMEAFDEFDDFDVEPKLIYKYEEKLPVALSLETNQYILESLVFTNKDVIGENNGLLYTVGDRTIQFL